MAGRLEEKVVWITGASRGIGAAMATAAAAEGARVALSSRKADGVRGVADEINERHPGAAISFACHAGDSHAIERGLSTIEERFGCPDVLVNNAATNPYFGPLLEVQEPLWDKTFQVNLRGPFFTTRAVVRRMQALEKSGSIINVASIQGWLAAPHQGVYAMTKAALISMTQTLALELGPGGIRVNAIAPGLVQTRLAGALTDDPEFARTYTDRAALRRYGQPDELAGIFLYLASDDASYATGQVFTIDGGYSAG